MISISIIVPIYGVEKHIERCLRSIMRQDYEGPIECILVDDCGPDNSVGEANRILEDYQGKVKFRWVHHEKNKGLSGARNTGTKVATGDYVFYLDSDDEIITHAISSLARLAEKYPGVDLVYGDWYVSSRYNLLQNKPNLPEYTDRPLDVVCHLLRHDVAMTAPNKLIRRQYMQENHITFLEGVLHEDEHMNCLLANTAQSVAISYVPTYFYYLNPNGITGSYGERNILSIYTIVKDFLGGRFTKYPKQTLCYAFNLFFGTFVECPNESTVEKGWECFSELIKYSRANKFTLLSVYMSILSSMPYTLLKRIRKSFLFGKINGLVYRYYMRKS